MYALKNIIGTIFFTILFQYIGLQIFNTIVDQYDMSTILMSLLNDPTFIIFCFLCAVLAFRISGDAFPETGKSIFAISLLIASEYVLCTVLLR